MKQLKLFDMPEISKKTKAGTFNDYDGFVEKFKPKKTTDDCYTPQPVYDAVLGWVRENADIEGCEIVRPFYPGGDYENYDYPAGCVVVDNPPFSIITKITRFYSSHNMPFFLFAPHLTLLSAREMNWTGIVCNVHIRYENGAVVSTSFLSNLFDDIRIMTAPSLYWRIREAQEAAKVDKTPPKYRYPDCLVSSALLGKIAPYVDFSVKASECRQISKLDQQGKTAIFGGGFLLSNAATRRKLAAEKNAKKQAVIINEKRAIAREARERAAVIHVWELSERERKVINELD